MAQLKLYQRLRQERVSRGITIRALEKSSGVSAAYISQIETSDQFSAQPKILRRLASSLKIDYMELMILAGHITRGDLKGHK